MVKFLIVDDFLADRRSIRSLLNGLPQLNTHITNEAENSIAALEMIAAFSPDIVISDLEMPLCDGFELERNIRIHFPAIKIIDSAPQSSVPSLWDRLTCYQCY